MLKKKKKKKILLVPPAESARSRFATPAETSPTRRPSGRSLPCSRNKRTSASGGRKKRVWRAVVEDVLLLGDEMRTSV